MDQQRTVEIREKSHIIGFHSIMGTRKYQQDYVSCFSEGNETAAVICDGMGGLNGGETASEEAAKLFLEDFRKVRPRERIPEFLRAEAARMDAQVAALRGADQRLLEAGTTVVAVILQEDALYWLSVGDSRICRVEGNYIQTVTREHNYRLDLTQALTAGRISQEQFIREEQSRQAEALTSYLGMGGLKITDVNEKPIFLSDGDIILLCSDGLYKSLDQHQILGIVRDNDIDMNIAAERLTDMALAQAGNGQDNTTVLLIEYRRKQR